MQDYIEKAREQVIQMELENMKFHAKMQRVDSINNAISAALQVYRGTQMVLALSGLTSNYSQPTWGTA